MTMKHGKKKARDKAAVPKTDREWRAVWNALDSDIEAQLKRDIALEREILRNGTCPYCGNSSSQCECDHRD